MCIIVTKRMIWLLRMVFRTLDHVIRLRTGVKSYRNFGKKNLRLSTPLWKTWLSNLLALLVQLPLRAKPCNSGSMRRYKPWMPSLMISYKSLRMSLSQTGQVVTTLHKATQWPLLVLWDLASTVVVPVTSVSYIRICTGTRQVRCGEPFFSAAVNLKTAAWMDVLAAGTVVSCLRKRYYLFPSLWYVPVTKSEKMFPGSSAMCDEKTAFAYSLFDHVFLSYHVMNMSFTAYGLVIGVILHMKSKNWAKNSFLKHVFTLWGCATKSNIFVKPELHVACHDSLIFWASGKTFVFVTCTATSKDRFLFWHTHTHVEVVAKITSKRHVTTSTHTLRFGTWSVVSAEVLVITWRTARYLEQRSIDSLSFHFFLPEIYFLCGVYFFSLP